MGAKLGFLRWGKLLDAEEQATNVAFARASGVEVTVDSEWHHDIRTKAAVAANVGSAAGIVRALHSRPDMLPDQLLDLTAVVDHLGGRADRMAMADDIDHANFPVRPVGVPTEMHLLYPLERRGRGGPGRAADRALRQDLRPRRGGV